MDANTSYSGSSNVDDNPPPKKMKMRQTTLQFRRVERTQSSPECHATASSVSSTAGTVIKVVFVDSCVPPIIVWFLRLQGAVCMLFINSVFTERQITHLLDIHMYFQSCQHA